MRERYSQISCRRRLLAAALVFMLLLALAPVALAQGEAETPAPVRLEIRPETLTLRGETVYTVVVVARNGGSRNVSDLELTSYTELPVQLSQDVAPVDQLSPGSDHVWPLSLSRPGSEPVAGTVLFQLTYTVGEGEAAVRQIVLGELEITAPERPATEAMVALSVLAAEGGLNERRAKQIYVVVENKGAFPVDVETLRVQHPDFVSVTDWPAAFPLLLGAGEKQTLMLTLAVEDQVAPGQSVLVFEGDVSWTQLGQPYRGTVVASQEVEIGVLGESQILTLLGIPTLLFLPGFLIMLTIMTFWGFWKSKEEKEAALQPGSVQFWFFVILLSLLFSFLYPWLTERVLGERRDFLGSYGYLDIVYLTLGSVLIGAFVYFTYWLVSRGWVFVRDWYVSRREPTEMDTPAETLQKLDRKNESLERMKVRVTVPDREEPVTGFILRAKDAQANAYWVAARIEIQVKMEGDEALNTSALALLNRSPVDVTALLALVPTERLGWSDAWPYPGPVLFDKEKLKFLNETGRMVDTVMVEE